MIKRFKSWLKLKTEKCQLCKGRLRKEYDSGYGGIDVNQNIGGSRKETFYVCNLCYDIYKKL
jgi:uncharacterized protein with PIN domain